MKIAAGIILLYNNKVLLCHPTNAPYTNSFSFPKGGMEDGEDLIEAALRECKEEVGININKTDISTNYVVNYFNKKQTNITKQVTLFLVTIKTLNDINLTSEVIPANQLQQKEIDWAGFLTKSECKSKIFWRFEAVLEDIFK
jgi:ADP-ribose pyrophosphatase YjhB (NUDIX family)